MLVSCDGKQLEWRGILELSGDRTGIAEVLDKQDTHALNQDYLNLGPGKPGRLIAKIFLFRTIFRGNGWSFANDPDFMHVSTSAKFWDGMNEKFYKKYNGIDRCHNDWASLVMSGKTIIGPLGREWFINNRDKQGNIFCPWTTLTNYPCQGTCADVMALARVVFWSRFSKLGLTGKPIQTVHDSIVVDAPDKEIQTIVNLFHETFAALIPTIKTVFDYVWTVPLECETSVGMNMLEMKPIEPTNIL